MISVPIDSDIVGDASGGEQGGGEQVSWADAVDWISKDTHRIKR